MWKATRIAPAKRRRAFKNKRENHNGFKNKEKNFFVKAVNKIRGDFHLLTLLNIFLQWHKNGHMEVIKNE